MVIIIAEVKTKSPFGFKSDKSWDELFEVANNNGDWLSIHTNPLWGGDFELIKKAKSLTDKPILAKGIHESDEDIEKALEMGADYVLVVGRIPKVHLDKCLIEPNSLKELGEVPKNCKVVWNKRDLATGGVKSETFKEAREIHKGWICQASLLKTKEDIEEGADAVLVGQELISFVNSLKN
jgi:indole-3-glycerol phosphate synthase